MNAWQWYLIILLLLTAGCESQSNRVELEKKLAAVNQKEQELLFKEKRLQLKEEELLKREANLDSSIKRDTVNIYNPALIGTWSVAMTCIETTCEGSAVGDTKNERWDISYQQHSILAKAMSGNKLVRVYTGRYNGSEVELSEGTDSTSTNAVTKMIVRLNIINENALEGQREIVRENECKITYKLELVRKQSQAK